MRGGRAREKKQPAPERRLLRSASRRLGIVALLCETLTSAAGAPVPAVSSRGPGRPAKLTVEQVKFARLCRQMREKYPSAWQLARQWGVAQNVVRDAARGYSYKDVPWREGML